MSEVENTQETNGTSNGDVPEIELIIKEEYMLDYEFVGNTNERRINIVANDDSSGDVDEKENIVYSKLQAKQQQRNNDKQLSSRKDILAVRHSESTESDHVLMLTHYDNQNFHFEYVKPIQSENSLHTAVITERTAFIQQSDNFNNEGLNDRSSLSQRNRVQVSQNHLTEEITVKDENVRGNSPVSNLDFAAMVAEACEGIFDEIENDLRSYNDENEDNSCHIIEPSTDAVCCSDSGKKKKRQHNSEAVRLAANAVLEDGLSLGEAAKRFNVVRSTVSSRVAKHPKRKRRKPNKELEELIHSKLMAGIQISEISRCLHVPKSTVHLHKTRLKNNGLLPAVWIRNGSKDMVDHGVQERLMQAYRGHIVNGMSVRFAAEFFSLPLTTLWRFIKRRKNATTAAVTEEHSTECAAEALSEASEEITIHNATNAFEELGINDEYRNGEMLLLDTSATCSTNLGIVLDKEEETLEQSLMNQLLE